MLNFERDFAPAKTYSLSRTFRFGHSLLSSHIRFTNGQGKTLRVPLKRAFFDQQRIRKGPRRVDNIFRGLIKQKAQELDVFIVNDVRNALFGKPGKGGDDDDDDAGDEDAGDGQAEGGKKKKKKRNKKKDEEGGAGGDD